MALKFQSINYLIHLLSTEELIISEQYATTFHGKMLSATHDLHLETSDMLTVMQAKEKFLLLCKQR